LPLKELYLIHITGAISSLSKEENEKENCRRNKKNEKMANMILEEGEKGDKVRYDGTK
jgi:hypothetical protein